MKQGRKDVSNIETGRYSARRRGDEHLSQLCRDTVSRVSLEVKGSNRDRVLAKRIKFSPYGRTGKGLGLAWKQTIWSCSGACFKKNDERIPDEAGEDITE